MSVEELLCAAPAVAAESVKTVSLCEVQLTVGAPAQGEQGGGPQGKTDLGALEAQKGCQNSRCEVPESSRQEAV